jgi:hypothetical protein
MQKRLPAVVIRNLAQALDSKTELGYDWCYSLEIGIQSRKQILLENDTEVFIDMMDIDMLLGISF